MHGKLRGKNDSVVFLSLAEVSFVFSFSIAALLFIGERQNDRSAIDAAARTDQYLGSVRQMVVGNKACFGYHQGDSDRIHPYPVGGLSIEKDQTERYKIVLEDFVRLFHKIEPNAEPGIGRFGWSEMTGRRTTLLKQLQDGIDPLFATNVKGGASSSVARRFSESGNLEVIYVVSEEDERKFVAVSGDEEKHKLLLKYINLIGDWSKTDGKGCEGFLYVTKPGTDPAEEVPLPEDSPTNLGFFVPNSIRLKLLPTPQKAPVDWLKRSSPLGLY